LDPISAIGLAFSVIRLALAVIDFLKAHPKIGAETKTILDKAADSLNQTRDHIQDAHDAYRVEAP
jgi:hypothetical protein